MKAVFEEAVRLTLDSLEGNDASADQVASLLRHQHGNLRRAETLLMQLLDKRDQWLPLVGALGSSDASVRTILEDNLNTLLAELIEIGRAVTLTADGKTERYALTWNYAEPYFFIPFLTGFGGWIADEDGNPTLDTPEMRRALQFVLDLRDKHGLIPRYEDYNTANLMFLRRRAAMIIRVKVRLSVA
jgi:hypothetical protein